MKRETLTVSETAQRLGIGKNTAYEAIRSGEIPALRFGKRIVIPLAALEAMFANGRPAGEPTNKTS